MVRSPEGEEKVVGVSIGKIEDVPHWLLECDAWYIEQQPLLQYMRQISSILVANDPFQVPGLTDCC